MNSILIIITVIAILCIFAYLASAAVLTWLIKLFKIENASFKKSLIIILLPVLAGLAANILFTIINLGIISSILSEITIFLVFYYLLKKYYFVGWIKSLGIYIAFSVAMVVLSLLIVIPARQYIVQPFYVSGNSMSPNYNANDYLILSLFDKQLNRGDVVVSRNPKDENQFLIKRVIGLPGEKIEIKNNKVIVNGQDLNEPYVNGATIGEMSLTLNNNEYFVLGDNRNASLDSRVLGPVKNTEILGKVIYNFKH